MEGELVIDAETFAKRLKQLYQVYEVRQEHCWVYGRPSGHHCTHCACLVAIILVCFQGLARAAANCLRIPH